MGAETPITQGAGTLGSRQTAFDAEAAAIDAALQWHRLSNLRHMVIRPARSRGSGAQALARVSRFQSP